jgi:ABC-2 type transport system ATP-binding protein
MIEARSLTRHYAAHTAVDGVSFSIQPGEVVGLLGHNGAGKTTIMRLLTGYLEPSAGAVLMDGKSISEGAAALQRQLGYLPENPPLYPEMVVADYLDYAATLKEIPAGGRIAAVREALAATDLLDRALDRVDRLSRGMRQRVGVAQAILGRPRLLILDEPTNGLDLEHTEHMRQLVRRLAAGATIILSTHIMQEVEAMCSRVLVLRDGHLVLDRSLDDLRDSRRLVLRTCGSSKQLPDMLRRLPQVASVESDPQRCEYILELHPGADPDTAAGNIARCAVETGDRLYCLQPLLRDLGSIFRDASAADEATADAG